MESVGVTGRQEPTQTQGEEGGARVCACVKRIFTRAEQTNKRVIRDDSLFPPLLLLLL